MIMGYIIDETVANSICAILVTHGENRFANKLCSLPVQHSECYKTGYAEGSKSERERICDFLYAFANTSSRLVDLNGETGDESDDMVDAMELKQAIESLRRGDHQ